ncbi:MAG: M28 family peptidase [Pseudomonadales bacterium]|nr:M28 family peptidase [Pseudomonadales bacterium]
MKTMNPNILLLCHLFLLVYALPMPAMAQQETAWYGLPLPPAFEAHTVPAIIGSRGPAPAVVPAGEEHYSELNGSRLQEDLRQIVAFSRDSRIQQELGGSQLWGRVSGFPSAAATTAWAAEQFRAAGIEEVQVQRFAQDEQAVLWLPERWEVRLLASTLAGPDSEDVVLSTAVALPPSEIPGGMLEAPLVYVGTGSPAELYHIDVAGKIAVQQIIPQAHLVFEREHAVSTAQSLMANGAVAVLNLITQPGNEMARDLANCDGPCFNIGGRDGVFLGKVLDAAAQRGHLGQIQARLSLQTREHSQLQGENAIAVIPGTGTETIVINAHTDAWYDGAGDNGDGLAVLMAMARHFARPEISLKRNLVLIASAGHHTTGLNGPRNAVRMNPEIFANSVLIFNLEHVAQRNFSPARSLLPDGYREFVADSGEAPIVAGISNSSPLLNSLFDAGVQRYGTNFVSGPSTMASGEGGGYRSAGVPIVTTMQAPPLYHTSGEVLEVISTPGLERMARFMAFFIKEVDLASVSLIDP